MTIIDPMHNLFLGTTKRRMLIIRKDNKTLLPEHFKETQKRMELVQCPSLPQKTFNADQYKNWTILFIPFLH